jgi:hypothetical protein
MSIHQMCFELVNINKNTIKILIDGPLKKSCGTNLSKNRKPATDFVASPGTY